jgi:hypothetical protein
MNSKKRSLGRFFIKFFTDWMSIQSMLTFVRHSSGYQEMAPAPVNTHKTHRRGVVNSAGKNKKKRSLPTHFIHFQLQNIAPCLQIPSNIKETLGKIIPVALKYLIFAMQNSPCGTPQAHRSDFARE